MLMNDLLNMKLFRLLSESSPVTNHEIQYAYEDFVKKIQNLNQAETNNRIIYRLLNFTRIEYQSLQTQILYGQGEKCIK